MATNFGVYHNCLYGDGANAYYNNEGIICDEGEIPKDTRIMERRRLYT